MENPPVRSSCAGRCPLTASVPVSPEKVDGSGVRSVGGRETRGGRSTAPLVPHTPETAKPSDLNWKSVNWNSAIRPVLTPSSSHPDAATIVRRVDRLVDNPRRMGLRDYGEELRRVLRGPSFRDHPQEAGIIKRDLLDARCEAVSRPGEQADVQRSAVRPSDGTIRSHGRCGPQVRIVEHTTSIQTKARQTPRSNPDRRVARPRAGHQLQQSSWRSSSQSAHASQPSSAHSRHSCSIGRPRPCRRAPSDRPTGDTSRGASRAAPRAGSIPRGP